MDQKGFKLKYAPHFGMFQQHAGQDLIDQIKFIADEGFPAIEDNGMGGRDRATQEKIASEMARLNLTMGVFVATATFEHVSFAGTDSAQREKVLSDMRNAVDIAKRVNAKWCTVVPGLFDLKLAWGYQTANAIDLIRRCCEICEKSGLVMVFEPLISLRDHPRVFFAEMLRSLRDLPCREPPVFQDSLRPVPTPDHRRKFDPQHRRQLQRNRLLPVRRQSWPQRTDDR